jgi:copper chaperone CopZ
MNAFVRRLSLFALIAVAALPRTMQAHEDHEHASEEAAAAAVTPAQTKLKAAPGDTTVLVTKMHCAGCAKKVAGSLFKLKGVKSVRTDYKANLAIVTPQKGKSVDPLAAWKAVEKVGFAPTRIAGPAGTYVAGKDAKKPEKVAETAAAPRG